MLVAAEAQSRIGDLTVGVLGPFRVAVDGRPLAVTAGRLCALLAMLAVHAGHTVSLNRLAAAAGEASALNGVGWFRAQLGDYDQALLDCQRALTLHHQTGNRNGQASTWDSLGFIHHHRGDTRQAIACYEHALATNRELGDRHSQTTTLDRLGDTYRDSGDLRAAGEAWQAALDILSQLNHPDAGPVRGKLRQLRDEKSRQ